MIRNYRVLHLVIGIITFLLFLGTGAYMRLHFPEAYDETEVIRYQYRANHIYILFSGLVNIGLGLSAVLHRTGWRRAVELIGSWFPIAAPVFLVAAFFNEPPHASPLRPLTFLGVALSAAGVGLHAIGALSGKRNVIQSPPEGSGRT